MTNHGEVGNASYWAQKGSVREKKLHFPVMNTLDRSTIYKMWSMFDRLICLYVNWAARNISILRTWCRRYVANFILFFGNRNGLTFANKQTTRFHSVPPARNKYNFARNYYNFILRMYCMRSQAHSPLSSNARLLNEGMKPLRQPQRGKS